jgi:hypothetical protein
MYLNWKVLKLKRLKDLKSTKVRFRSSVRVYYAYFPFNAFMYMERLKEIEINN